MSIHVFRRREQKYKLDEAQKQALVTLLESRLEPDRFKRSTVCNIYYDTADRRLIRRSLEKPVYKEKFRLRSYGTPQPGQIVFLELKKKYKGVVYKRRVPLEIEKAVAYMQDPQASLDAGQIGREIDYFKRYYSPLEPAVYLSYDRLAWRSPDGDLRVTLDWNVCYQVGENLDLRTAQPQESLLEPGEYLLEVKTPTAMPLWLVGFISKHQIRKISFSKYGHVHMHQVKQKQTESRGFHYA